MEGVSQEDAVELLRKTNPRSCTSRAGLDSWLPEMEQLIRLDSFGPNSLRLVELRVGRAVRHDVFHALLEVFRDLERRSHSSLRNGTFWSALWGEMIHLWHLLSTAGWFEFFQYDSVFSTTAQ